MKRLGLITVVALVALGCGEAPTAPPRASAVDPPKLMEGTPPTLTEVPAEGTPTADATPAPADPFSAPVEDASKDGEPVLAEPEKK